MNDEEFELQLKRLTQTVMMSTMSNALQRQSQGQLDPYQYSLKLEEAAKGEVRITVHVYSNDPDDMVSKAIEIRENARAKLEGA